jgi:stringent starvation protein B
VTEVSTKPYLIRAIHEWCVDNGYTPYLAVSVNEKTRVPQEFVKAGEIVLNVSPLATNQLSLGNDAVEFQARFSGVVRELFVPMDRISAIYARENGHGMAFEVPKNLVAVQGDEKETGEINQENKQLFELHSATPDSDDSQPLSLDKSDNLNEKTSKKPGQKKKNHLTRVK